MEKVEERDPLLLYMVGYTEAGQTMIYHEIKLQGNPKWEKRLTINSKRITLNHFKAMYVGVAKDARAVKCEFVHIIPCCS